MTGKTHQIIGLTTGLTVFLLTVEPGYSPATLASVLVVSHLAALLPDIDQPAAQIWGYLPMGKLMGELSDPFLEHRNLTHSVLGVGLVGLGLKYLLGYFPAYWGIHTEVVFICAIAAYASHLLADMLTVEGIPLFFPWKKSFGIPPHPFAGLRISTGKWFENLVLFPVINLIFWLLVYWQAPLLKVILLK